MAVLKQSELSRKSDRSVSKLPKAAAAPKQSTEPAALTSAPSTSEQKGPRKRREQARAIETREVILDAALSEFAERGYDAASIRNIANRTGIKHPLITYHYPTKEVLWQAVAEGAFSHIEAAWREADSLDARSPAEAVRLRYEIFLQFTLRHPDFHHFMLRENTPRNPRLPWLVKTILQPLMAQILPDISLAQKAGDLPNCNPFLFHYMMIGIMSVLSSLRDEIKQGSGIAADDPDTVNTYVAMVREIIFYPRNTKLPAPTDR